MEFLMFILPIFSKSTFFSSFIFPDYIVMLRLRDNVFPELSFPLNNISITPQN